MKNRYLYFKLSLSSVIMLGLVGCEKFVTIDPPVTQQVSATVFSDDLLATTALVNIYNKMEASESLNLSLDNGLLGDELTSYDGGNLFYKNLMNSFGYTGPWQNAYNYIYQANSILEGLEKSTTLTPAVKQQLMGEAFFIRAFWHFILSNIYVDVPLALTSDYSINAKLARTSQHTVYQQVIADLRIAEGTLSSSFIDGTDTTTTTDRGRPNKWAAAALLSRVYLYNKQYDSAVIQASMVLSNTSLFTLLPTDNLGDVFKANSNEAIWQLDVPQPIPRRNTPDAVRYILLARPTGAYVSMSPQLLGAFETGDVRKDAWVDSIVTNAGTYYFPYKYKAGNGSTTVSEYTMVLRLAEQYLVRAEASAQLGNITSVDGAISDLNIIRDRAGLLPYGGPFTADSVLAAILHERQVELFTEWGHRWFDLIRTGNVASVMGSAGQNVCAAKGTSWNPDGHQALYPIPQTEILNDPNLTQNKGY